MEDTFNVKIDTNKYLSFHNSYEEQVIKIIDDNIDFNTKVRQLKDLEKASDLYQDFLLNI